MNDGPDEQQFYAEVMAQQEYEEWAAQYEAETQRILMGAPRPLTVAGELEWN